MVRFLEQPNDDVSAVWGGISGLLMQQLDLQAALDAKQATLVSATNIKTINGASILGSGNLTIASGVAIGDTITSATAGSILFAGAGGILAQDNANFAWNNTTDRLVLTNTDGTTRTKYLLDLVNGVGNAGINFPFGGAIVIGWDGLFMGIPNVGTFSVNAASTVFPSGSFQMATAGPAEIFSGASSGNTFTIRGPGAIFFNTWYGGWGDRMVVSQDGRLGVTELSPQGQIHVIPTVVTTPVSIFQGMVGQTADLTQWQNSALAVLAKVAFDGVIFPLQAVTASAPVYVLGGMYFDTTLNKLRIGGASGWETVQSI